MNILITGGAGYIGSKLVPKLLNKGHSVEVIDLCVFGIDSLAMNIKNKNFKLTIGNICNQEMLRNCLKNKNAVIHLVAILNDSSFELNPDLAKIITYEATRKLVDLAIEMKIERFIFTSTASVYGIKEETEVTEDLPLNPITDYSKYKALCEEYILLKEKKGFCPIILRLATVCGISSRQRFDSILNSLSNMAINLDILTLSGGHLKRPLIHIDDITDFLEQCLEFPVEKIEYKIFNIHSENHTIEEMTSIVLKTLKKENMKIIKKATDDIRSYHLSSKKIQTELGFLPQKKIEDAVLDIYGEFKKNVYTDPLKNPKYHNIITYKKLFPQLMESILSFKEFLNEN